MNSPKTILTTQCVQDIAMSQENLNSFSESGTPVEAELILNFPG